MNSFSFPFKSNIKSSSPATMAEFFNALGMETDGFYPFGINEFWHGGVHITNKSNVALKQGGGIQCIADGEVVAYRINEKHIDTPAYEDPDKGSINIPYSSSFTLVRHTLEYPKDNKLFVFSLYMHLLPWDGYESDTKKNSPAYFGKVNYKVSQRAKDNKEFAKTTLGANARLTLKGKSLVISRIPQGSLLELEGDVKAKSRAKIKRIISGTAIKNPDIPDIGYVYIPDLEKQAPSPTGPNAGKPVYKVKATAKDTEDFAAGVTGTRARIYKNKSSKLNPVLHLIPRGAELILEDNAGTTGRAKIISIKTGDMTKNPIFETLGTVWVNDLDKVTKPDSFDTVETKATNKNLPKKIHKGDKIGYMGNFCTPEVTTNRPMLHWEIFTGDNLKPFIGKARSANAKAKKSEKTVLKIPKGTPLVSPLETPADTSIASNRLLVILKTQGEYIQCQTVGDSVNIERGLLGDWDKVKKYYTPKKSSYAILTTLLGQTVNESSHFPLLLEKGSKRAIQIPQATSEVLWVEKSIGLNKLTHNRQQVKTATEAWTKYPETFTNEITTVAKSFCIKPAELTSKKQDETGSEWYEIGLTQERMCYQGYIDSKKIKHHAPEEFICFEGVDVPSDNDASYHLDPNNSFKNLLALNTMERSEEEDSPVSDFRLDLKPFAKKVFQHMDENHDGTITLTEVQNTLKDPIKQKKIAQLITKHESEWVKSMDRWKYVEKYMPDTKRYDWDHEKSRIEKLAWWDDVKGKVDGFPKGEAYYFHPAGFVGNFAGGCELKIQQKLLTKNKWSRPETKLKNIKAIVLHWVANPMSSASGNRSFFESRKGGTKGYGSAHYIIGLQGEIIQCIPDDELAYHVGAKKYTTYAKNNLSNSPNNCTIGIELTHIDWEGKFKEETLASAVCLCRKLLNKFNLTTENIIRHYDVTGKDCPKYFMNNPDEFTKFKNRV